MEIASTENLLATFEALRIWRAGDQRAPYKPLLALWAIGRCLTGEPRLASYHDADRALRALLRDFGPHRAKIHTEHPFWRLRNDGVWEVEREENVTVTSSGDAHRKSLLEHDIHAGFSEPVHAALTTDENLARQIAHALVDAHFPASLHDELLQAVGIDAAYVTSRRRPRDRDFPERVLAAYGHRCAVCGFAVRLRTKSIELDAAHIKWHGAKGPDVVKNALSLCALHHRLFDKGAFTLSPSTQFVVTTQATGPGFEETLGRFHSRPITLPAARDDGPDPLYSGWHTREVFFSPGFLTIEEPGRC